MLWVLIPILFNFAKCDLQNVQVARSVDLHSPLVKVNTQIVFKESENNYVSSYTYLMDFDSTKVNYVKFTDENGIELFYNEVPGFIIHGLNTTFRAAVVYFGKSNTEFKLNVEEEQAFKIEILQRYKRFNSPEFVKYKANLLYFSPYDTLFYKTSYNIPDLQFVNFQPNLKTNNTLNYVFSTPIKKFSIETLEIEFVSDAKFLHVLNLERQIDISLYGKIMITDVIELKNKGANVHGEYKQTTIPWLYTHLPASAEVTNLYDDIGAFYTWQVFQYKDYKTLKFKTRYPLHGGWKTTYNLKYTVPTYEYIEITDVDQYEIKIRVVDHVLNDAIVEKFTTRLILPENANVLHLFVPAMFMRHPDEKHNAFLTQEGRQVIVVTGRNVLEKYIQDFTVKYSVDSINLLLVPFKLSLIVYGGFVVYIIMQRMEKSFVRLRL